MLPVHTLFYNQPFFFFLPSFPPPSSLLPLSLPQAFSYDEDWAIRNLHLSGAAYCPPIDIESWNVGPHAVDGFEPLITWTNSSLQAYVGYDAKYDSVVAVVRGSEDVSNWIDNLDAITIYPYNDDSCVGVHQGFFKEFEILRPFLLQAIANAANIKNTDKLILTGHSSGASNAILLAYDVARSSTGDSTVDGMHIEGLFTYGAPRVGNPAFADGIKTHGIPHSRVVHYHDAVPHVPMSYLGYQHSSDEVWYTEDSSSYSTCDGTGEDPDCSDSCSPLSCTSFSDHTEYLGFTIGIEGCAEDTKGGGL